VNDQQQLQCLHQYLANHPSDVTSLAVLWAGSTEVSLCEHLGWTGSTEVSLCEHLEQAGSTEMSLCELPKGLKLGSLQLTRLTLELSEGGAQNGRGLLPEGPHLTKLCLTDCFSEHGIDSALAKLPSLQHLSVERQRNWSAGGDMRCEGVARPVALQHLQHLTFLKLRSWMSSYFDNLQFLQYLQGCKLQTCSA
jgi:hypothetical protein